MDDEDGEGHLAGDVHIAEKGGDDVVRYRLTVVRKMDQMTFICTKRYR